MKHGSGSKKVKKVQMIPRYVKQSGLYASAAAPKGGRKLAQSVPTHLPGAVKGLRT